VQKIIVIYNSALLHFLFCFIRSYQDILPSFPDLRFNVEFPKVEFTAGGDIKGCDQNNNSDPRIIRYTIQVSAGLA
jgi:hypothetical protein